MRKHLLSRHKTNKSISEYLNSRSDKLVRVPILSALLTRLVELNSKGDELLGKVENVPQKTAGNKNLAKEDLVNVLVKAGNALIVYARHQKDDNLLNFIVTSENKLDKIFKVDELLPYAKNLLSKISSLGEEALKTYGWNDATTAELETEINDLEAVIAEPRRLIADRKTSNELLEDTIFEAGKLCREEISPLIELFIDDREFYLGYKAASMIVDPATRSNVNTDEEKEE